MYKNEGMYAKPGGIQRPCYAWYVTPKSHQLIKIIFYFLPCGVLLQKQISIKS